MGRAHVVDGVFCCPLPWPLRSLRWRFGPVGDQPRGARKGSALPPRCGFLHPYRRVEFRQALTRGGRAAFGKPEHVIAEVLLKAVVHVSEVRPCPCGGVPELLALEGRTRAYRSRCPRPQHPGSPFPERCAQRRASLPATGTPRTPRPGGPLGRRTGCRAAAPGPVRATRTCDPPRPWPCRSRRHRRAVPWPRPRGRPPPTAGDGPDHDVRSAERERRGHARRITASTGRTDTHRPGQPVPGGPSRPAGPGSAGAGCPEHDDRCGLCCPLRP